MLSLEEQLNSSRNEWVTSEFVEIIALEYHQRKTESIVARKKTKLVLEWRSFCLRIENRQETSSTVPAGFNATHGYAIRYFLCAKGTDRRVGWHRAIDEKKSKMNQLVDGTHNFLFFLIFGAFRFGKKYFYCLRTSLSFTCAQTRNKTDANGRPIFVCASQFQENNKISLCSLSLEPKFNAFREEMQNSMHRTEQFSPDVISCLVSIVRALFEDWVNKTKQ